MSQMTLINHAAFDPILEAFEALVIEAPVNIPFA